MLGLYVSDHPLMGAERALRRYVECSIADLAELDDGTMRTVAGVVTALQRKYTKRGDLMATFVLEDLASSIEVMVFPKTMAHVRRAARTRRDRHGERPRRRTRRHAEADGDGDHPPRDPPRQRAAGAAPGQGERAHRRTGRAAQGDPRRAPRRQPGVPAPRRPRQGDRAPPRRRVLLRAAPTACSPSSASSSAPTASCSRSHSLRSSRSRGYVCAMTFSENLPSCVRSVSRSKPSGGTMKRDTPRSA